MNRKLHILKGMHAGAEVMIPQGTTLTVGRDTDCDVVLSDASAAKQLLLTLDAYGATCRILAGDVAIAGRTVVAGQVLAVDDLQPIRCGDAVLGLCAADASADCWDHWHRAQQAAGQMQATPPIPVMIGSLRRFNPYALFMWLTLGIAGIAGLAWAALSSTNGPMSEHQWQAAQGWLQQLAPPNSELQLQRDGRAAAVITGYVSTLEQRQALEKAALQAVFKPRVDVVAIEEMLGSVSRMSHLAGVDCAPRYQGQGVLACANVLQDEAAASRMRQAALEVVGVKSLLADVTPTTPTPTPAQAAAPTSKPVITHKFAVLMYRQQRFLVDAYGKRYAEGDVFDGFTIARISLDEVIFSRGEQQYIFALASLRNGA